MTETSINTADITGKTLKSVEAWQTGHFILTSGKHSSEYMQCQKVMQYPRLGNLLADLLIEKVLDAGLKPETVVGPALGAIHWELYVAQALERKLCKDSKNACDTTGSAEQLEHLAGLSAQARAEKPLVKAVFAEKIPEDPGFAIRRGIELKPGEKILVVEDVTTTGGSARKVVEMLKTIGCDPVAVGAVVDRSGGKASFDVPFINLLALNLETYEPDSCPLCEQGSAAIKPGSTIK
ncbi:MAG: orotate phosphoribosyltransferase [Candidatus Obscuribacterales bacterium]|nr:orotate phosphoribosyltransferase [Candidatus Obscuribacterales bacterium]